MIETPAPPSTAPVTPAAARLSWRQLVGLTHLSFAHQFLWTTLLVFVIPVQVVAIAGERDKAGALSTVLVLGAAAAVISQIVAGGLSDHLPSRYGRRRPFIVAGTVVAVIGLYLMSTARSLPLLLVGILLLQLGFNSGQPAFAALIPDRVPAAQRGSASGLLGLMAMLGTIAAAGVAGKVVKEGDYASMGAMYAIVIALKILLTSTTVWVLRDDRAVGARGPFALGQFLSGVAREAWLTLRNNRDFAWVFVTRFLVMMGYWTVLNFLFYYVRDQLGHRNAAAAVSQITAAVIVAAALTIFFGGHLSDRFGRKPIVYLSAGLMAAVSLAFSFVHTVSPAVVVGALWGLGWGAFQGVDWALATDTLPRPASAGERTNFARYMGVWSLAVTLPQVFSAAIGPAIDALNARSPNSGYLLMFGLAFVYFLFGAVLVRYVRVAR